jgi:hypothetical protein
MLRHLLAIAVILGLVQSAHPDPIPASDPSSPDNFYLPLVVKSSPIEVVSLGQVDWMGYPGYVCLYGYVTSLTTTSYYSVTLAMDVTEYPYCDIEPEDCPPSSSTYFTQPELQGTLPGQVNPFEYCLMYAKNYFSINSVDLADFSPTPPDGRVVYPLTVTSQLKEGSEWETTVSGTLRNDSGRRLDDIRMVGIAGTCSIKHAALDATSLEAGEETAYLFERFYCGWSNPYTPPVGMLELSAQGVAAP